MKKITPASLKKSLFASIDDILEQKDKYLVNPQTAFSRTQKISFHDAMLFPIVAASESTSVEMLDFLPVSKMPSQPAMNYRRDQIKVSAFSNLFKDFTAKLPQNKTYHGMHLIACDGTRLNTPYNPKDPESFVCNIEGRKGFNQYHLNTCYDVLNDMFTDAVIQGYFSMNEKQAFCEMMDRYPKDKPALFIADRGYASYNVIAHAMHNDHNFVIRLTSAMAKNIFDCVKEFTNLEEFDIEEVIHVGRIRTKEAMSYPNYHCIHSRYQYDYIPAGDKKIDAFQVRLVKIKLSSGEDEYLLTNLAQSEFTISDLKYIYRRRWRIETAYRCLKYVSGMVHIHSIKNHFIFQEIYAKLIGYNYCATILRSTKAKNSDNKKYIYVIDKTYLFKTCIRFLKGKLKKIQELFIKRKVPVRAGRKFERILRRQHADTLQYR